MEDINSKAQDDELNKAEDRVEGEKRDNTPLPKSINNKKEKEDESD